MRSEASPYSFLARPTALTRGNVTADVTNALRHAIVTMALPPGSAIDKSMVCAELGVSRFPVSEALARLQAEGLVDARPKRTATVAQPSLSEARDVFEVRRALEAEVVRLVIKRWKPAFGAELEGLVREEDAAREQDQPAVWGRLAGEFHITLARLSGNAVLERYMEELVTRCSLILAVYGKPHAHDGGANEHAEIIAALRAGDADKAVAIMDHHMEVVERRAIAEEAPTEAPALGDVLSRYSEAINAPRAATPIRKARK